MLFASNPDFFVKFSSVTPTLSANKKTKPLFQTKYTFSYWKDGQWNAPVQHQECILTYPAWCGDGVVDTNRGETCDPQAPGYSPETCDINTCTPITQAPVCNPAITGTQSAPVLSTDTLCTTGTASGFTPTASGTTTNYTWSCNTNTAVNCSANYTPPVSDSFDLSIKKYIDSYDAQSGSTVGVRSGSGFNYVIKVKNE